jgi:acetyl-CoA carboxylase carboxyltransferase component
MFKGGALDPDACDKITSFIVLCDSFNIPLIFLADTPGFLVGAESEKKRLPGKIMNFMAALELSTVPKIALVLRKSYGQAYLNMGGGRSDVTASWFSGDISFMDPAVAVNVVYAVKPGEDPARYEHLLNQVSSGTTAYELAAPFMAQMVIDPNDTRRFLTGMLDVLTRRMTNGVGTHRLADWPPAF